jgi:hypothetical protein
MSDDWEGDEFEEVGGGETEPTEELPMQAPAAGDAYDETSVEADVAMVDPTPVNPISSPPRRVSDVKLAASIETPRTPSVEVPTQDERSLLERLDAISALLHQPAVGGGAPLGGFADLSGHAIRNRPVGHAPLQALDAQQRFANPRAHYAHQLDCFYHYVFLETAHNGVVENHIQRLYDEKRSNIPLLLSEFLGSEDNLFRLLMLKYNRPEYSRFVHFDT